MKNSKKNLFFYIFVLIFGSFVFSACENKPKTNIFVQENLTMAIEQELDLKQFLNLEGVNFTTLEFETSNSSIVHITPRKTLYSGALEGTAIITIKGYSGSLEIQVEGSLKQFEAPKNLIYDPTTNIVSWDVAILEDTVANNYVLNIIKDGQESNIPLLTNNYKITDAGNYEIKVKTGAKPTISQSEYSLPISFTKLAAPKNITFNDNSKILSWDSVTGATGYKVSINGVLLDEIQENNLQILLEDEKSYDIYVKSLSNESNTFGDVSQTIKFTRLKAPQITFKNSQFIWTDDQQGVSGYNINVYEKNNPVPIKTEFLSKQTNDNNYAYNLDENIASGDYYIKVSTICCDDNFQIYLSSKESTSLTINKLQTLSAYFDKFDNKVKITDFNKDDNLKIKLILTFDNQSQEYDISQTGEFECDYSLAGDYIFTVVNVASQNQLNSNPSSQIKVIRLGQLQNLSQSVNSENLYTLTGLSLELADKFEVSKTYQNNTSLLTNNQNTFGNVNNIFDKEGLYTICVTASSLDANLNILPSQTILKVYRLKDVTLTDNTQQKNVTWQKVSDFETETYSYKLLDGEWQGTDLLSYDYSSLPVGEYSLTLKAKATSEESLILDSLNEKSINFKLEKQLQINNLKLEKQGSNYYLISEYNQDILTYEIKLNGQIVTPNKTVVQNIVKFDITDLLKQKGIGENNLNYEFSIIAKNESNNYFLDSEAKIIKCQKLQAVKTFNISNDQKISCDYDTLKAKNCYIAIDNVQKNNLDLNTLSFNIKIKLIAQDQKVEDVYYLDSEIAEFNLKRQQVDLQFKGINLLWNAEKSEDFNKYVYLTNHERPIDVTEKNSLNLREYIQEQYLDSGVDVYVEYQPKNSSFNLNGSYVEGVYKNGTLDNGQYKLDEFIISSVSSHSKIQYYKSQLFIEENQETFDLTWLKNVSEKYLLFDGSQIQDLQSSNKATLDTGLFEEGIAKTLSLTVKSDNQNNVYLFNITKLNKLQSFTVKQDETFEYQSQTGSSGVEFKIDDKQVTSAKQVQTSEIIKARYISQNIAGYNYYLNSSITEFNFTRLNVINNNNFVISDVKIEFNKDDQILVYNYDLNIYDEATSKNYLIEPQEKNILNVKDYLVDLDIDDSINFKIAKIVGEYTSSVQNINYLSSGYSNATLLKILKAPTNVKATEDITNNQITISWDMDTTKGYPIKEYEINFTGPDKSTFTRTTQVASYVITEQDLLEDILKTPGKWQIKVKAVGKDGSQSSDYSEICNVNRLTNITNLKMDKDGKITWDVITGATSYDIIVKYVNSQSEVTKKYNETTNQCEQFILELQQVFDGNINIFVTARGDKDNLSSSEKSITYERLKNVEAEYLSDKIIIKNYSLYPENTQVYADITIDLYVLNDVKLELKKDLVSDEYYYSYPKTFTVIEQGTSHTLDLSNGAQISYNLYAKNDGEKYISSNKISQELTMLASIKNIKIFRDQNDQICLSATNQNTNLITTNLYYADQSQSFDSKDISFLIDEGKLSLFETDWQILLLAKGGVYDQTIYIDSVVETIKGEKLSAPQDMVTDDCNITFKAINYATSYWAMIDSQIKKELNNTFDINDKDAGDYLIKLKALGNITSQGLGKFDKIYLDSDFGKGQTITKLQAIQNLQINKGLFVFENNDQEIKNYIYIYSDEACKNLLGYDVISEFAYIDAQKYYYSNILQEKLKENQNVYVKFINKTNKTLCVSSNFATINNKDYLWVKNFINQSQTLELYHPTKADDTLDYSKTFSKWEQNILLNNGYLFKVDNNISFTEDKNIALDSDKKLLSGQHKISYAQVGSNGIEVDQSFYYIAEFTLEQTIQKLETVNPSVKELEIDNYSENKIVFNNIKMANSYLCFLDDELNFAVDSPNSDGIDLNGLVEGVVYESFGIVAVNTQDNFILASNITYLTADQNAPNAKAQFTKLKTPKAVFKNGELSLQYESLYNLLIDYLSEIINDQKLIIKFTNKLTNVSYQYVDYLYNYLHVTDEQKTQIRNILKLSGNSDENIDAFMAEAETKLSMLSGGFGTLNHNFKDLASDLPAGEYNVSLKMIGDYALNDYGDSTTVQIQTIYFSSEFKTLDTIYYVAEAPVLTAMYKDNDYILTFNNVSVNQSYIQAPIYQIVGIFNENEKQVRKVLGTAQTLGVNNPRQVEFSLSNLVQDQTINENCIGIFVMLKGNDANVFNSKVSNVLEVKVLSKVNTWVEDGILKWDNQLLASGFKITYTDESSVTMVQQFEQNIQIKQYTWLGEQLVGGNDYLATIQAIGTVKQYVNQNETLTISGIITNIGKLFKLQTISDIENGVNIKNGRYTWSSVQNATAYDVYIDDSAFRINTNWFETNVSNEQSHIYTFMTIGTQNLSLNENTVCYLNSKISNKNYATRVGFIESVSFVDGVIKFTPKTNTGYYKLTFSKIVNNVVGESIEVYTTDTSFDTNQIPELTAYGNYVVNIQAAYENKTKNLNIDENETYYLISQNNTKNYIKIDCVNDIKVKDGVVSWTFANYNNLDLTDYKYTLIFEANYNSSLHSKIIEVASDKLTFEDVVFDDITTDDKINLKIFVSPSYEVNSNIVNSSVNEYSQDIYQYTKIDHNKIKFSMNQLSETLTIDWTDGAQGHSGDFVYELEYILNDQAPQSITTELTSYVFNLNEISLGQTSEYKIKFRVRVIPNNTENYISSPWTNYREITRPKAVENLIYDTAKNILTWDQYTQTSSLDSYVYKVRDTVVKYVNGQPVTEVYVFNIKASDQNSNVYTPFIVGMHKLEVAVLVNNADLEQTDFMSEYVSTGIVWFEMFADGSGTKADPFIIATSEQFKNISFMMQKDSKLNNYFKGTVNNNVYQIDDTLITASENIYYFKQSENLIINKNSQLDETLNSFGAFNGNYNADYNSITLVYTQQGNDYNNISIFDEIGKDAIVQNVKLIFQNNNANSVIRASADGDKAIISVLCKTNNGTISNVVIGDKQQPTTINITTQNGLNLDFSLLAYTNNGVISDVVNYSNVNIVDQSSNKKTIQFATLVIYNTKTINRAKNNANLVFETGSLNVGGICLINSTTESEITNCAMQGQITINYLQNVSSIVGGLVAKNQGKLNLCYSKVDFLIYGNNSNAIIGGLIGESSSDNLKNSYAITTLNQNSYTNISIYLTVGKLTAVSSSQTQNIYYMYQPEFVAVGGSGQNYLAFVDLQELQDNLLNLEENQKVYESDGSFDWELDFDSQTWK